MFQFMLILTFHFKNYVWCTRNFTELRMSWTVQGAESVMRLRAVHINKDWDAFWKYRRQSERRRLYGIEDSTSSEIRDQELKRAA